MLTLQITEKPTFVCYGRQAPEISAYQDFLVVWAKVSDGTRFRIRISAGYCRENWEAPWFNKSLVRDAFERRKDSIQVLAESELRAGQSSLDL